VLTSPDWEKQPKTWEPVEYQSRAIYD